MSNHDPYSDRQPSSRELMARMLSKGNKNEAFTNVLFPILRCRDEPGPTRTSIIGMLSWSGNYLTGLRIDKLEKPRRLNVRPLSCQWNLTMNWFKKVRSQADHLVLHQVV